MSTTGGLATRSHSAGAGVVVWVVFSVVRDVGDPVNASGLLKTVVTFSLTTVEGPGLAKVRPPLAMTRTAPAVSTTPKTPWAA
jgi:hypothetical protein